MGGIVALVLEEEDPGGIKKIVRDRIIHGYRQHRYSPITPEHLRAEFNDDGLEKAEIYNGHYTKGDYPKQETFEAPICRE